MERSGRNGGNRSQTDHPDKRSNKPSRNRRQPPGNGRRPHGKEGVDGSSPSEGLKYLQIRIFYCLI